MNRRYPFLPPGNASGWLPYLWLVYLIQFLIFPIGTNASITTWMATLAGVAIFLPLYFAGYWVRGFRVLWVVAGLITLGTAFAAWNPGAGVFYIYAASFIGQLATELKPGRVWLWLGGLLGLIGIVAYFLQRSPVFWMSAVLFSALIGTMSIVQVQQRQMYRRLAMAQEETERLAKIAERERIARDLHDLLGHTLSVIVLKSELASRLAERDTARAATEIRDVERISRDALTQVRAAVRGYRSAGLATEVEQARTALTAAGVQLECNMEPCPLTPLQENVLSLVIREGITNIVRHARAGRCNLSIRTHQNTLELRLADDGVGAGGPEGNGLQGMRERVELLGGTMERNGGRGTEILVRLPWEASA